MNKEELIVVTFCNGQVESTPVYQCCREQNLKLEVLGQGMEWGTNSIKIKLLQDYLTTYPNQHHLFLVVDAYDVLIQARADELIRIFHTFETNILFGAEANFYFRNRNLEYYYWKFYPRQKSPFDYLNSGTIMGTVEALLQMVKEITSTYEIDLENQDQIRRIRSDQYLYSRYFVDNRTEFIQSPLIVKLDHDQQLFACTGGRMSAIKRKGANKVLDFLSFRNERAILKFFKLHHYQLYNLDLSYHQKALFHRETHPLVVHIPGTYGRFNRLLESIKSGPGPAFYLIWPLLFVIVSVSRLFTLIQYLRIILTNKGVLENHRIFRYTKHGNPVYEKAMDKIIGKLATREPFAFSHFNDGELTFIMKALAGKKDKKWFGRKQNQYSFEIGQSLTDSLKAELPNYLVGVPCATTHPELNRVAKDLKQDKSIFVPAMTLHHNLAYLPRILGLLKNRNLVLIMGEKQDPSIWSDLGISISQTIRVPAKNSYLLEEEMKSLSFEKNSVVIFTCGMLPKVLIPYWFQRHPQTTFITFGSILDDFIQVKERPLNLYPKRLPWTGNLRNTKRFLFGVKEECPECFTHKVG